MVRTTIALLLIGPLPTALPAQQARALALGPGQLICLSTHDGGEQHVVTLHVADCDGDSTAKPFWQNHGNVDVIARLDRNRLLLASYGEPYALIVVDVGAGKHRVLADGSPHDFVARHGDEVLFLGDNRWDKGDNFLYAAPWQHAGKRRRLGDVRFASVPIVAGNLAFGITADWQEVHAISVLRGTSRKLAVLAGGGFQARLAQSPGGQRLAIGTVAADATGTLQVVDVGSGKIVRTWKSLRVELPADSSFSPTLEVAWFDDENVVASETRGDPMRNGNFVHVRRNVATGEAVDEAVYAGMALYHRPAPLPGSRAAIPPLFTIARQGDRTVLTQAGMEAPLASQLTRNRRGGDLQVAPDGRSVIARLGATKNRCTLFRPAKRPLLLLEGSAYGYTWLPAVDATGR